MKNESLFHDKEQSTTTFKVKQCNVLTPNHHLSPYSHTYKEISHTPKTSREGALKVNLMAMAWLWGHEQYEKNKQQN